MELKRTFDLLKHLKAKYDKPDILVAKRDGEWVAYSVSEYILNARDFALGLITLGLKKGDKIATVSNNRPEWNFVDMGMSMAGVIHVPIYPTIGDEEYTYIFKHSDVRMLIVSDKTLYTRLSALMRHIPGIECIYTFNQVENAAHWSRISGLGDDEKVVFEDELQERMNSIAPNDIATIIYTSGTTGYPKGVMLSHRNILSDLEGVMELFPLGPDDRALSFLPLCHVFERIANYLFQAKGCSIYYAENLGSIAINMKEIRATVFATVPRVIESIYDRIVSKGEDLSGMKKWIFFWAMRLGEHYPVTGKHSFFYNLKLRLARRLVFSKWSEAFGGELKFIISGGAALQARLSRLFFAAGIPLMEGYGLTETSPVIAVNHMKRSGCLMIGTVGPVLHNQRVKIADDGEILVKGDNVMAGYYKDDRHTGEVINRDGWFHTGDVGTLIDGKFLKICDRKKEMFKLSNGKYIAPQVIENLLKESIFIEQAMVIGDNEKFASALICPNFDHLHLWAHEHKVHFRDNKELIHDPRVLARYQKEVGLVNKQTGKHEEINRFRLVCEPWNASTGELSPTLKLRRRVLYRKYAHMIRDIYGYKEISQIPWLTRGND